MSEQIDRAMELVKEYAQRQGWAVWSDWSMTKRSRWTAAGGAGTYRIKVEIREGSVCVVVYCPPMLSEFYTELVTPICGVAEVEAVSLARVLRANMLQWR